VVGGIFILKDAISGNDDADNDDDTVMIPDWLTRMFESFVGLFMLALGFYGIYEAHRIKNGYSYVGLSSGGINGDDINKNENKNATGRRYTYDGLGNEDEDDSSQRIHYSNSRSNFEIESTAEDDSNDPFVSLVTVSMTADDEEGGSNTTTNKNHQHHHHDHGSNSPFLALCAGVFHGLAGPGGVLGVVPAIQLHDAGLAACYLLSFCASSTLTMGTFAAAYGTFTTFLAECCSKNSKRRKRRRRSNNNNTRNNTTIIGIGEDEDEDEDEVEKATTSVAIVEFWIRCFSASLSVLVGVVWLVLLSMGKLEDVFG